MRNVEAKALEAIEGAREKVHRMYAEAFAKANESIMQDEAAETKKAAEGGVKLQVRNDQYSEYDKPITVEDVEILRSIIAAHDVKRVSINDFTSEDIQKAQKWAYKFYKELGVKSPFFRAWFGDWRALDDKTKIKSIPITNISVTEALNNMSTGSFFNPDVRWEISVGALGKNDTYSHSGGARISVKMLSEIQAIIENAVLLDTEVSNKDTSKKHNETTFMHKLYAPVSHNGKQYIAKITVEEYGAETQGKRFYNHRAIKIDPVGGISDVNASYDTVPNTRSIDSISDLFSLVKQYDKDFKPKAVHESMYDAKQEELSTGDSVIRIRYVIRCFFAPHLLLTEGENRGIIYI